MEKNNVNLTAYVGTYTKGESKGIYSFNFNSESGKINDIKLAAEIKNPTYLAIDKKNKFLYSVSKESDNGGVAAFSINNNSQELNFLNSNTLKGAPPCHISLTEDSSYLFSANYHKGEIISYPLSENGNLQEPSSIMIHSGSGPNKERQSKPCAHYVSMDSSQQYVCSVDLGIDKLVIYKLSGGKLCETDKSLSLKPGCGPRHLAFHPNNKFAYILTELSSEVIALDYDYLNCTFKELQYISALPEDFSGESIAAAINISKDGNYLYTSNRGHDSIATFKIDQSSGRLTLVAHTLTEGKHPRDFTLSPDGRFLIVANLDTNNIVVLAINPETGVPSRVVDDVTVPEPVCIKFLNN